MIRLGIVGSGPAAFYTAQKLLKSTQNIKVDMFEKLPVPFGLVRYGVAPDHPEVKNVIHSFTQVARHENFRFFGNVNIGKDIQIKDLRELYHGIVLAFGAAQDKQLGIPGEELKQVYSAIDMVGWYNGLPEKESFSPDLTGEEAVIIGHGNVALDIARVLLSPIDTLKKTDIPDYVLSQLSKSRLKNIHIVGRRGPLQVAFTIKELRELINMHCAKCKILLPNQVDLNEELINNLPRPKKRLTTLIVETFEKQSAQSNLTDYNLTKNWFMHFLQYPRAIYDRLSKPGYVDFVRFGINDIEGDLVTDSGKTVDIPCQLVIRSIGYQGINIDPDIPFDNHRKIIPNINGKVIETSVCDNNSHKSALYCVGWIKRGPVGVILNTLSDAQETSSTILEDMKIIDLKSPLKDVNDLLNMKGIKYLSFVNWEALDRIETSLGEKKGKPREKLTNIHEMLLAATKISK